VAKVKIPKYHERDQDASTAAAANMQQIPPKPKQIVFIHSFIYLFVLFGV
jgi:hypothetical protein